MAVVIRLRRGGKKKSPFYHIVAADSRSPRDGKFLEKLGFYDPSSEKESLRVNDENIQKWVNNGAQMSDTVRTLLQNRKKSA